MKFSKYIVLVAGAIGVVGFFLPLVSVTTQGQEGTFTAYSLVSGIENVGDHFPGLANLEAVAAAEAQAAVAEFNSRLAEARPIFLAIFVPSALLALFALLGIALGRFGRGFGAIALLCAIAALAIYAVASGIMSEAKQVSASAGIGAHLVAVSGLIGAVGGLVALIKPDLGQKTKGKRFKATIASRPPSL